MTPSVSERPDIFQASQLAFSLKNKKSPIQNLHHLSVPAWADLTSGPSRPPASLSASQPPGQGPGTPGKPAPIEAVTSVNPRSRPKGDHNHDFIMIMTFSAAGAGKHALPLPLQVTSLSGKQTAEPSGGPAPSLQFPAPGVSTNPFVADSFQDSGPVSLDPRQQSEAGSTQGHRRIASADTQTFHR